MSADPRIIEGPWSSESEIERLRTENAQLQARVRELEEVIPQIRGKLATLGREHKRLRAERDDLDAECEQILAGYEREKERFIGEITRLLTEMERAGQPVQPGARYVPEVIRDQQEVLTQLREEQAAEERARTRQRAFARTAPLTPKQRQALDFDLAQHGCVFGRGLPTCTWWRYLSDEEKKQAGVSRNTYDQMLAIVHDLGLYEREWCEPHEEGSHGYFKYRPVPEAFARLYALLDAGAPCPPSAWLEEQRAKRAAKDQHKQRKEQAAREARAARVRDEDDARRQLAYQLQETQRVADERARALEEAQRIVTDHQRCERPACARCGTRLEPAQLRCSDCWDQGRRDNTNSLCGPLNPKLGFLGTGSVNPKLGFSGLLSLSMGSTEGQEGGASPPAAGRCSDCSARIVKSYGRCAPCRAAAYARLGMEDPVQEGRAG